MAAEEILYVDPGYCAVVIFRGGQAVAAYLRDDYVAHIDIEHGIIGSTLSDANIEGMEPTEMTQFLREYLEQMSDTLSVVFTNDPDSCRVWLSQLGLRGYGARQLDVPARPMFAEDVIKRRASILIQRDKEYHSGSEEAERE